MADLTITEANVIPAADAQLDNTLKSAAAISIGQVVYKDSTGKAALADARDATAAKAAVYGIAVSKTTAAGQPITILKKGKCAFGSIITDAMLYVLSHTAGAIKEHGDLASTDRVSLLGIGVSATEIDFRPWNTGRQLA